MFSAKQNGAKARGRVVRGKGDNVLSPFLAIQIFQEARMVDKVAITVVHTEVGLHATKTKIWKSFFKLGRSFKVEWWQKEEFQPSKEKP